MPEKPPDPLAAATAGPNATVRSLATLAILIHLFCVLSVVSANLYTSELGGRLRDRLAFYTRLLNFDLNGARYHLSFAVPAHDDHFLEIEIADGPDQGQVIEIPRGGIPGASERRRRQTLAYLMGLMAYDGNDEGLSHLARSVGAHVLDRGENTAAIVRVRRQRPIPLEVFADDPVDPRNPNAPEYFGTAYEGRVWRDREGNYQVLRIDAAGEVAPVTNRSTTP